MSKRKGRKIELPIDEIVEKWKQGTTQTELAIEYGVSTNTINKRISEYYEKIVKSKPKRKPKPKPRIELPIDEIVEKWKQGATQRELAKEYGVSVDTIGRRIGEYHKKIGKPTPKRKQKIELPINKIIEKWKQGATRRELAKEYGVSVNTIGRRISEYHKKIGKPTPKRKQKIELPIDEIVEKWKRGSAITELAKEYVVSQNTINNRISEYYENIGKSKPKRKTKIELPIDEIVEKWKQGATQRELAKEYGTSDFIISSRISEYEKKEIETKLSKHKNVENNGEKLRIVKSSSIIAEYLRKGLTIQQIESIALKRNIIIPQKVIEKAIQKNKQLEEKRAKELDEEQK